MIIRNALSIKWIALSIILATARPSHADTVAFFFALDADLAALKGGESIGSRTVSIGSTVVQGFNVGPHKIWAVKMGAGNVETAINSATLLSRIPCDFAISAGPAGALAQNIKIGQWYRVRKVTGYQRGTFGADGWQVASGAIKPISADPIPMKAILADWKGVKNIPIASGDAFIAQEAENARIAEITGALAVDMNSFGVASSCENMKTPLIIWKVISDRADSQAGEDFRKFISTYDGAGGLHIRKILLQLAPTQNSPEDYENIRKLMR